MHKNDAHPILSCDSKIAPSDDFVGQLRKLEMGYDCGLQCLQHDDRRWTTKHCTPADFQSPHRLPSSQGTNRSESWSLDDKPQSFWQVTGNLHPFNHWGSHCYIAQWASVACLIVTWIASGFNSLTVKKLRNVQKTSFLYKSVNSTACVAGKFCHPCGCRASTTNLSLEREITWHRKARRCMARAGLEERTQTTAPNLKPRSSLDLTKAHRIRAKNVEQGAVFVEWVSFYWAIGQLGSKLLEQDVESTSVRSLSSEWDSKVRFGCLRIAFPLEKNLVVHSSMKASATNANQNIIKQLICKNPHTVQCLISGFWPLDVLGLFAL